MRNAHKILARKPQGKWPLGRSRRKWKDSVDWAHLDQDRNQWVVNKAMNLRDNIKVDKEIMYEAVDWIHLAQDRV